MPEQHSEITTNLYINPSYITARYDTVKKERSILQQLARTTNFATTENTGKVSKHTSRKIRIAIQWLVALAEKKQVYHEASKKTFDYKAGLATVALPTGCSNVHPDFFKKVLLTSLLDAMNYQFGLKNYIWKIERQSQGNLHAHITIDKFIPHEWLLKKWCEILDKNGLIDEYRSKFGALSCREYVDYRKLTDNQSYIRKFKSHLDYIKSLIAAYRKGCLLDWSYPNCTDIHSVKNIKNLASYMVKYLSKDPKLGEGFKGRYWSCSHSLSKLRSITVSLPEKNIGALSDHLSPILTGLEELYYFRKSDGEPVFLGALYFLKRDFNKIQSIPFLRQLFGTIKNLYHQSRLPDLPYFSLISTDSNPFHLHSKYLTT